MGMRGVHFVGEALDPQVATHVRIGKVHLLRSEKEPREREKGVSVCLWGEG